MNRKHRRKRAASRARSRGWLALGAGATLLAGILLVARTATKPDSERSPDGVFEQPGGADPVEELVGLVAVYRAERRSAEAIRTARQLTEASPNDPRWWRLLALKNDLPTVDALSMRHKLVDHLLILGDAPAGRREFEQLESMAENTTPQDRWRFEQARLDVHRARLLRLEGHPREALDSLNRALSTLGNVPMAIRLRGILFMDLDEFENAVTDLEYAARELPYDEIVHYKLSAAFRRLRKTDDADRHLQTYQHIHDVRLEIQEIEREAQERPLSHEQRQRLAHLYQQVGKE